MAQQVFGPAAVVSVLNRAFTNTSPSNAVFNNQLAQAGTTEASQYAFAESFGATFAVGKTAAELSALVMANMGLDNKPLADELTYYITVHGTNKIGIIAYQLGTLLSPLENDATYGAAAKAWNAEVTASYEYSADPSNTVPSTSDVNGNEAGKNFVLTVGQDVRTGTSGADFFRGVAGVAINQQDQTTLNSSDILDGGLGQDTLVLLLNGAYGGGARIKGIETLQLGTNMAAAASFDYNVNAGFNEISEVTKIVFDQINNGEALTVNNVIKTADVLPTIAWYNDSANAPAGTATVGYRAAQVSGNADIQAVEFNNVSAANTAVVGAARLNIDAGIETIVLGTVEGSSAITLNTTANADTTVNNVLADIISTGSLTKVELVGKSAFGKAAGIVAATGLTDRVAASDLGITAQTTATSSNLLSVGSRVTTVDASALEADSNIRFTAKNDNSNTDVTFLGGSAKDYVEFERGAVNADGGAGDDTFAFITTAPGITNSGFGSTDTIKGGEGADTVQIGLNGVGTYTLNTTEFNNKTGIEVLDIRGQNNDITVSSEVVAAADTGKFTIRTDKMVQSAAGAANAAGTDAAEDTSTSVINLTALNQNQGVVVMGGSGSDRIVVNNASLNAATEIDGGTNGGVAGRYDTLTILNTTVADEGDLANVKGIESMILAETVNGNSRFDITLTAAFLLNNTAALNAAGTTIDDSVFRIGSATSSTGTALNAGDIVTIDISGLLNPARTALATNLAGRGVDVSFAAGVTVNYVVDGLAATAAQVGFVTKADAARADAGVASAAGGVVVAPAFTGTAAVDAYTLVANADGVALLAGNDTLTIGATTPAPTGNLDGGAGVDAITLTAAANLSGAAITGFETLNVATFATTVSSTQLNGFTTAINGTTGLITINDAGAAADTAASTATSYALANGGAFTANAAVNHVITVTNPAAIANETVTFNAAWSTADSVDLGAGTGDTVNIAYNVGGAIDTNGTATSFVGVENLIISAAQAVAFNLTLDTGLLTVDASAAGAATTVVATNAAMTSLKLGAGNDTITTLTANTAAQVIELGAGNDTITGLNVGAAALTVDSGIGNLAITDIAANGAGVFTLKFGAPVAGTTATANIAATTANFKVGDVFDFASNVTSVITGAANGTLGVAGAAGQLFVDQAQAGGNTTITFDADGSRTFSAGDVQIVIVGNVVSGGINAAGDFVIGTSA